MQRLRVAAAVIQHDGRVLLTRRASGQKHAGFWEFPGGKLEPGENHAECLRRELFEELGVDAQVGNLVCRARHAFADVELELDAFFVTLTSYELTLSVHDAVQWLAPAQCLELNLLPADRTIAERLQSTAHQVTQ